MNKLDVKKRTRGITFWREDLIKFDMLESRKSLSSYVREMLHDAMGKHRITDAASQELDRQIRAAYDVRRSTAGVAGGRKRKEKRGADGAKKNTGRSGRRDRRVRRMAVLTCGEPIPESVRDNPKFVKESV